MKLYDVSALANASRELLSNGDPVGAERVLSPVFNQLKSDVSVLHLMGLIMKAQDKLADAERYLRAAVANSLSDGQYYNDLGVVLQARGDYAGAQKIFRAAIALMPGVNITRVNLVRCMLAAGELAEAEREARAFLVASPSSESWSLMAAVLRGLDKREESLAASESALRFSPQDRQLRINYALALDRAGRTTEALKVFEGLADKSIDTPELANHYARALYQAKRHRDAEAVLIESIKHWPSAAAAHTTLAGIHALGGAGDKCTAVLEAELAKRPDDVPLYLLAADALHRSNFDAKAARILDAGLKRAPDDPALLTAQGIILDELDRPRDALALLLRAEGLTRGAKIARRNLLLTLLRARQPDDALRLVRDLQKEDRDDQFLLAVEASALRALGDARYQELNDYEHFVKAYDIPAPRGFFTPENFNAALSDSLRHLHRVWAHPLDQSIDHGSQTGRSLLAIDEPNLKAFFAAIDFAIRDYINALKPGPDHPLLRRKRRDFYRLSNAWSTRLTRGGKLANHVHDKAWITGVYVAGAPASFGANQAGWMKLGEAPRPVPNGAPEFYIEPRPGRLILFPAYIWHGVLPFEPDHERLSIAFDIVPG